MTSQEQMDAWVRGESHHRGTREGGECCPDFSCCQPALQAPEDERRAFVAADEKGRMRFLATFLGAALREAGLADRVHIAGKPPGEES